MHHLLDTDSKIYQLLLPWISKLEFSFRNIRIKFCCNCIFVYNGYEFETLTRRRRPEDLSQTNKCQLIQKIDALESYVNMSEDNKSR